MRIMLLTPSFENISKKGASYPLGIAYIGAVLEREKYSVSAYDFLFENWEESKLEIINKIRDEKPDIIGLSCMTTNRFSAFQIAVIAKKINPKIKIILGGVHPTLMYKQILNNFPIDFVVIGEGEKTILELVGFIKKNKSLSEFEKIKGIAYLNRGKIIKTETRPFIKDIDELPMPNHLYFREKIKKNKIFYLTTSRGCPFSCTFCSSSLHWGRMVRRRSPERVIEELKFLKKEFPDVKNAVFNDDEFVLNKNWIIDFCNLMIKENLGLTWTCAARVTSITEEIVVLLKRAGCECISLGLESASPKMIKYMNKCITLEQVENAFNLCKKHSLQTAIFLMVGLPGEDRKTIKETIKFTKKLPTELIYLPSVYQVFPGTQTYELAKKQGFISDDFWLTDKPAPFYTFEHSRPKLIYWSFKIAFFHNLYSGHALRFLSILIKTTFKKDQLRRIINRYFLKQF